MANSVSVAVGESDTTRCGRAIVVLVVAAALLSSSSPHAPAVTASASATSRARERRLGLKEVLLSVGGLRCSTAGRRTNCPSSEDMVRGRGPGDLTHLREEA